MYFHNVRNITVSGFVADADPRSSAPAADKLFNMGHVDDAKGHAVYLRFVDVNGADVLGATASFTSWIKDDNSGKWVSLASESAAPSAAVFTAPAVGVLFVQVTALGSVGASVTCQVWAAETN